MLHRKLTSIFLCLVLCLSLSVTAFAADSTDMSSSVPGGTAIVNENFAAAPAELQKQILANEELTAAANYAYMDISTADKDLNDVILTARKTIIYSQSWVADGYEIEDLDGNIVSVPVFSDLFPSWDLPTERASEAVTEDAASNNLMTSTSVTTTSMEFFFIFNGSYNVPAAVSGQIAPIIPGTGAYYYGRSDYGPEIGFNGMDSGGRCNLGWSRYVSYTWVDVGYLVNQYAGNGYMLKPSDTVYGAYYAARASTFDTPSLGYFYSGYWRDV